MSGTSGYGSRPSSFCSSEGSSFVSLVEKHAKPYSNSFNEFATSYICFDLPVNPSILCDESSTDSESSSQPGECPFEEPIFIEDVITRERMRKLLGESQRKKNLIPKTGIISRQIENSSGEGLYSKARQWCEVNKALTLDSKYPKRDPDLLRRRYSREHQIAAERSRLKQGIEKQERIFRAELPNFVEGNPHLLSDPGSMEGKQEGEDAESLEQRIGEILGDSELPLKLEKDEDKNWQMEANKSLQFIPKPKKVRHWKKNVYPKKSAEEVIRERRKNLPPIKPENLQVDYLSGIWDPQLMIDTFRITPIDYTGSQEEGGKMSKDEELPLDKWVKMQESREKCLNWLSLAPKNL